MKHFSTNYSDPLMPDFMGHRPFPTTFMKVSGCLFLSLFTLGIIFSLIRISDVQSQYSTLQSTITDLQSQLAVLQNTTYNITNATNYPAVVANITSLQNSLADLNYQTQNQGANLLGLQTQTTQISYSLTQIQSNADGNYTMLLNLQQNSVGLANNVSTINGSLMIEINNLNSTISTLNNSLNIFALDLHVFSDDMNEFNISVIQTNINISYLTAGQNELMYNVTELSEALTVTIQDMNVMQENFTEIEGNYSNFQTEYTSIVGDFTQIQAQISNWTAYISTIQSNLSNYTNSISVIQNNVSTISTTLNSIQNSFSSLLSPYHISLNFASQKIAFEAPPINFTVATGVANLTGPGYLVCFRSFWYGFNITTGSFKDTYNASSGFELSGTQNYSFINPIGQYNGSQDFVGEDNSYVLMQIEAPGEYNINFVYVINPGANVEEAHEEDDIKIDINFWAYQGYPSIDCWVFN